ncbi:hypothetical protein [Nocardioides convexus]|uniref:hypothetical protein n=1 Tax=Nocardioides convexus TaxID=2712224 RepID=UPI0024181872|nr:hypothetical protein [Nocardioides convexus]
MSTTTSTTMSTAPSTATSTALSSGEEIGAWETIRRGVRHSPEPGRGDRLDAGAGRARLGRPGGGPDRRAADRRQGAARARRPGPDLHDLAGLGRGRRDRGDQAGRRTP